MLLYSYVFDKIKYRGPFLGIWSIHYYDIGLRLSLLKSFFLAELRLVFYLDFFCFASGFFLVLIILKYDVVGVSVD